MFELHDIPGGHVLQAQVPAHAAATATSYDAILTAPFKCKVIAIEFVPVAAIAGADTNSNTLHAFNNAAVEVAVLPFTNGINAVAGVPKPFTLSATDSVRHLLKGESLRLQVEKVGTGLGTPVGVWLVTIQGD